MSAWILFLKLLLMNFTSRVRYQKCRRTRPTLHLLGYLLQPATRNGSAGTQEKYRNRVLRCASGAPFVWLTAQATAKSSSSAAVPSATLSVFGLGMATDPVQALCAHCGCGVLVDPSPEPDEPNFFQHEEKCCKDRVLQLSMVSWFSSLAQGCLLNWNATAYSLWGSGL